MLVVDKKLQAIKDRSSMNITSGRVMMEVKDRDWLFSTIVNLVFEVEQLQKDVEKSKQS